MSSNFEMKKREILIIVEEINRLERNFALPEIDGLYDDDRLEAMAILNRLERKILANQKDTT